MNAKVTKVLDCIVQQFESGNIPESIALASYPAANLPSSKWSFLNRTIMFLSGTGDARGFNQWKQMNRNVKQGAKALYILAPCMHKKTDNKTDENTLILMGFKGIPVFRYEDTEGQMLEHQVLQIPDLPLLSKAKKWGISVRAVPGNYRYYGYYSTKQREIVLATTEEFVFFHELAHVAHEKIQGNLQQGQNPLQEIVAELSAEALCRIVGKCSKDTTGNSYRYIERYAKRIKKTAHAACLQVLNETENILNLILEKENTNA